MLIAVVGVCLVYADVRDRTIARDPSKWDEWRNALSWMLLGAAIVIVIWYVWDANMHPYPSPP